ncbi:uncharacterized protein [Henckelia pumila]|uniref:uncharacterized protein n=1 Tax=Henckelia pumila TaxID=405737 RepID=UPI003C6E164B
MDMLIDVDVWYGGRLELFPKLQYVGGDKYEVKNFNLDRLNFSTLYELYKLCGGIMLNVKFFFRLPGIVSERGLIEIKRDADLTVLYEHYKNEDNLTLWIEETIAIPLQVLDPEDNEVPVMEFREPMIRDKLVGDALVHDVLRSDEPESFGFGVLSDFDDDADESYKESGYSISSDEDNLDLVSEESIDEGVFDDRKKKNKSKEVITDDGWCSDPVDDDDEILSVYGSDDDAPKHPVYKEGQDMTNFKLMVGMKFKSAREFKFVLSDVSVKGGIEVVFYKKEKSRITAVCKEEECEWKIHASLVMGGPTFQIKTLKGRHTCSKAATNWLANYKYLAKKIEQVVRENPNVKTNQLINYIKRECGVNVSKWKAVRAKKYALQSIRGVDNVQYEILRDYCETVLKYNPGSRIIIRTREDCVAPTFGKLYYSLSGLKMNFLTSCRPIIGLDGCFLKTVHGVSYLQQLEEMAMMVWCQ